MRFSPVRTGRALSCSDLARAEGRLATAGTGVSRPGEHLCLFPRLPGAEESESRGAGARGRVGRSRGRRRWGAGPGPSGRPACLAAVGHCGLSFSPAGPLAAQLLASLLYAAIFFLVLLSGDATRCHLPASLQWLSRACLPRAWVVWKEEGSSGHGRGPSEARPSGPGDWPGVPSPARNGELPSLKLPAGHLGDSDTSRSTCKQHGIPPSPGIEAVWVGSGHLKEQCGPALPPPTEYLCSCDLARGAWGGRLCSAPPPPPAREGSPKNSTGHHQAGCIW